jgi:hypothetical protein
MPPARRFQPNPTALPSAEQILALKASLLDGAEAMDAWRTLEKAGGPKLPGIAWITPLLMANLKRFAPGDPWIKANPHFLTLCHLKTQALQEFAERILRLLEAAAVPTLVLKGLALGVTVYPAPGLRTVSDIDILVPGKDLFRAMDALVQGGLHAAADRPRKPADLRRNHAAVLSPSKRHEPTLDLHWHVLSSGRSDDDDAPFWAEARPLRIGGAATLGLCPEDQLLHALVHGVRWTRMPHVRWVADATLILRAEKGALRADRFLEMTRACDVVAPVQEGLRIVAEVTGEGRELLERALSLRKSRFAERAFRARATAYEERTVTDRIALRIEDALWRRRSKRKGAGKAPRA